MGREYQEFKITQEMQREVFNRKNIQWGNKNIKKKEEEEMMGAIKSFKKECCQKAGNNETTPRNQKCAAILYLPRMNEKF